MGELYAHLGEKKLALEYLQRAFQHPCNGLQFLNVDPIYDGLRQDPAFKELISRNVSFVNCSAFLTEQLKEDAS